jgi:ectoine hydroxylase-related dioxygenase (phytanoyl-CoA dioxygenase family)
MRNRDNWFDIINARRALADAAARELNDAGFIVIPGPATPLELARLDAAYDSAVASADAADRKVGSTTTRVNGLVDCGPEFDALYIYKPILEACCRTIRQPFKLSAMHARTLRPHMDAQDLHVDFAGDDAGWPMIGFIFMVDEFRPDNGATHFAPGSHRLSPGDIPGIENAIPACGPAGSVIVYNGSIWHEHSANSSAQARRSIQGAYIRREARSSPIRISPETLARIGPEAKYLLAV